MRAILSFYKGDEGHKLMREKLDRQLQVPLFVAVVRGNYKIVEWMMGQMDEFTRAKFFVTANNYAQQGVGCGQALKCGACGCVGSEM